VGVMPAKQIKAFGLCLREALAGPLIAAGGCWRLCGRMGCTQLPPACGGPLVGFAVWTQTGLLHVW
jgi:hypothetical protein